MIRVMQPTDVPELIRYMRSDDFFECLTLCPDDPERPVRWSIQESTENQTLEIDGHICAMGGIKRGSVLGGGTEAWLFSTVFATLYPVTFARETKRWILDAQARYGSLRSFVDARYTASVRWLEWIGFKPTATRAMGAAGETFLVMDLEG